MPTLIFFLSYWSKNFIYRQLLQSGGPLLGLAKSLYLLQFLQWVQYYTFRWIHLNLCFANQCRICAIICHKQQQTLQLHSASCRLSPQGSTATTLTMLWSITGQLHEKLASICQYYHHVCEKKNKWSCSCVRTTIYNKLPWHELVQRSTLKKERV